MKNIKIIALALVLIINVGFVNYVHADPVDSVASTSCVSLSYSLKYQSKDINTNGDVSTLQDFLQTAGYLSTDPSGYFSIATKNAVMAFQKAYGLAVDGFVGPITRGKLNGFYGCGGTASTVSTNTDNGCQGRTTGFNTMTGHPCDGSTTATTTASSPLITGLQGFDISSTTYSNWTAVAGKYLAIYGTFTSSGNTVTVGGQAYTPISQSTSQINILLSPSLPLGSESVTVTNANGVSNTPSVTIVSATSVATNKLTPVITSIQGYNATTKVYSSTVAAGQYLVLYGTFDPVTNYVHINNGGSVMPTNNSQAQLNVYLDPTTPSGTMSIFVENANGQSNTSTIQVTGTNTVAGNTSNTCVINSLTGSSASIILGQSAKISYSTSGCNSVNLRTSATSYIPTNAVASGDVTVTPNVTTTYYFSALNANGSSITQTITIGVNTTTAGSTSPLYPGMTLDAQGCYEGNGTAICPNQSIPSVDLNAPKCTISSFSVSPAIITVGQVATISWNTNSCTSVNIWTDSIGNLKTSGTLVVSPTINRTYVLYATNSTAAATPQSITLTVNPASTATGPVITGVQGFNATTGAYTTTSGTAIANQYLILYGSFATSGNTVTVGNVTYTPAWQDGTNGKQINVLLDSRTPVGTTTVSVTDSMGTSAAISLVISSAQQANNFSTPLTASVLDSLRSIFLKN